MDLTTLKGRTLPLNKDEYQYSDWSDLSGTLGFAAIELSDVANVLSDQDENWFHANKTGLPDYYRALSAKLIKIQQALFGYNVTGKDAGNTL